MATLYFSYGHQVMVGLEKNMGNLITIQEVMAIAGACEGTVRKAVMKGSLTPSYVSAKVRVYLFDEEDARGWAIDFNRNKATHKNTIAK